MALKPLSLLEVIRGVCPFDDDPESPIVLLDSCETIDLNNVFSGGESIDNLIYDGYIKLSNETLRRKGPRGVSQVGLKCRFNK